MVKQGFVVTFMAAPMPEEVGEGRSGTGSGIGALKRYLCERSKCSEAEEKFEKDLL